MNEVILRSIRIGFYVVLAAAVLSVSAFAQSSSNSDPLIPGREKNEQPKTIKEYLAKQRTEKDKKDHEELLKRVEEAAVLSEELDTAFTKNNQLTAADQVKLDSLEKLVTKIRKNLGADDDDELEEMPKNAVAQPKAPSSLEQAFNELKDMTGVLVDEVKKTTRFTVSAMAIQTSNSVLKLVRFLRFRK